MCSLQNSTLGDATGKKKSTAATTKIRPRKENGEKRGDLFVMCDSFQTGILFVLCFVSLCKTKGFFVCVCVKPKRSDFQKHTVHKLHIEHLAVSFPAPLAVLRLI